MDKRRTSNRSGSSRYARKSQGIKNPERQYRSENPKVIRKRQQKKLKQQKTKRWMRYGIFTAIMFLVILLGILRVSRLFQGSSGGRLDHPNEISEVQETENLTRPAVSSSGADDFPQEIELSGWQSDSKGIRYKNTDRTFYKNGWHMIDGDQYYFDENGYIKTGWHTIDGKDCYFNESGKYEREKIRPMVALTFDDGPGQYTEELLQCLEENNAKATFFMLGQNVERYSDTVRHMKELGMELANHTYSHPILTSLTSVQISNELEKTNGIIKRITEEAPAGMRPPGGAFNHTVRSAAGLPIIMWSIDTKDWKTKSEDLTYQCVMDNVRDGSVVLMHDINSWSVRAALRMIPDLEAKGFKLVTVEELAQAKGITLEKGKAYYYFGEGTQQVE